MRELKWKLLILGASLCRLILALMTVIIAIATFSTAIIKLILLILGITTLLILSQLIDKITEYCYRHDIYI